MSASTHPAHPAHPAHPVTDTPRPAPAADDPPGAWSRAPGLMARPHLPLSPSQLILFPQRRALAPLDRALRARGRATLRAIRRIVRPRTWTCDAQSRAPGLAARQGGGGTQAATPFLPLLPAGEERAGVRWGRVRALRTALVAVALAALAMLLPAPPDALANSYSRGNWSCDDFKAVEQDYRSDPEDINGQIGYIQVAL